MSTEILEQAHVTDLAAIQQIQAITSVTKESGEFSYQLIGV